MTARMTMSGKCRPLAWGLVICAAMLLSVASAARAQQCAQEALASFGPLNAFGFPAYYVDQSGQGLQMCFDVNDPLCGAIGPVPNPAAPLDVATGNFLPEAPYSFVTSTMTLPTGGQALLVLSVLGTWGNPTAAVINGTQTAFNRVRFRIDTPQGGLYTITYPFGVMQFNVAAGGRRSINFTTDCLVNVPPLCGQGVGNFFTTPLDPTFAHIGHFLAWNPAESAPPAGYLGNPAISHTVIGSPCGTNFFKVEGPGLPAAGAQTNLFSVQGKKAVTCGNGILDFGEQCDDGNTLNGDCCSATCRIDPAGTVCSDGSVCTTGDACTGGAPTCVGTAANCVDGNVCTTDSCDPVLGCQHVNNTIACSDGNACTVGDACAGGVCVGGPAAGCSDGNACTTDSCSAAVGCLHAAVTCDDGNACTTDSCDPATGCVHVNNTAACSDGDACTVGDACAGGVCIGGSAVNCNDGNACTADSCSLASGCVHTPIAGCVAGCTPTTCAAQGKNCGPVADGCGGTLTCGTCTAPQTCGGGAIANVCGGGTTAQLTLTVAGRAGERVRSTPLGLRVPVGTTGSATFPVGTRITLTVSNERSAIWSGVCSSGGLLRRTCTFTLNADSSESANVR